MRELNVVIFVEATRGEL